MVFRRRQFLSMFAIGVLAISYWAMNAKPVHAAAYTWDGGGSTESWSECANWSTNVCPTTSDSVTFDATSAENSTIDASAPASVAGFTIAATYSGTITQGRSFASTSGLTQNAGTYTMSNGFTLSVTGASLDIIGGTFNHNNSTITVGITECGSTQFKVRGGTFNGGSGDLNINHACGGFLVSSGTFVAPSGTMYIPSTLTFSGGTFTHNNGTVYFDGDSDSDVFNTGMVFYNVILAKTASADLHFGDGSDSFTIAGTFTLNDGQFDATASGCTVTTEGPVVVGAGFDGVGDAPQNLTWVIGGSATYTVDLTAVAYPLVTVSNTNATVNGPSSGSVTFDMMTLTAGTWNLGNANTSATRGVYISGGTMNQGSGTLTIADGSCATNRDFSITGGTFTGGSGAIDWNGSCGGHEFILSGSGVFTSTSTTFSLGFDVNITGGTFTHNGGTLILDGSSAAFGVNTTITLGGFTNNKTGGQTTTVGTGDTIVVTGTLSLTDGLLSSGTIIEAQGSVTIASTFDGGTTPLKFSGSATQTFTLTGAEALFNNDITVNKAGGAVNLASALTMDASGQDLIIQEGTFDLSGFALSVTGAGTETIVVETGGNLQLQGGETITSDSTSYPQLDSGSTVTYDGTSNVTLKNYTYSNLTIAGTSGINFDLPGTKTVNNLTITSGQMRTQGNSLTVNGTFSNNDTFVIRGGETLTLTMDVDSGTVVYKGDNDGVAGESFTIRETGATDFYNLAINDNNATKDKFVAGANLKVAGSLTVVSGTFEQSTYTLETGQITVGGANAVFTGGSNTITNSGPFTMTAGTFTSTSGTFFQDNGWTHTAGGTFTHNSGTVSFTGVNVTIDVATTETFSALTINKTDGQTLTIASGDTLIAVGALTLTNGAFATGGIQAQGNVVVASTWDAAGTGTLTFGGSGTQTFDLTGAEDALDNPVTVNKAGGSVTLASAYTINHANADFTLTLGTFSTGNYTFTTGSGADVAINGGTWNSGSSMLDFDSTLTIDGGTWNSASPGSPMNYTTFNLVSGAFNGSTGNPTFWSPVTISGGTFTASSGTMYIRDTWTHTAGGTFVHNDGTVEIMGGGTGTIDVATTETLYALTINNNDAIRTIAAGDTLIATGTLTLTDGGFATGSVTAQGNIVVGAGWDAAGSGTVNVTGSGTQTLDLSAGAGLLDNPLVINKAGGSLTLASAYILDHANADITLTSGIFGMNGFAITTSSGSDIAVNGGAFALASSTGHVFGGLVTVAGGTLNSNSGNAAYNGAFLLSSGTYNGNGSAPTFAGGLTISGGSFNATTATMTIAGAWTHTAGGTFSNNGGTVAFTGSAAAIDVTTMETFTHMVINKNTGEALTIASGDSLVAVSSLTLTDGAVNTGTLDTQGTTTVSSTFDGGSAPMLFSGSSDQTFTLTGATDKFNGDITVNKASGTITLASALVMDASGQDLTITLGSFTTSGTNYGLTVAGNVAVNGGTLTLNGSTVDLNGNLTVGGGTLNMGAATLAIAGDVTYTSGTMTSGTSSTTLDGTSQVISGATSWYNLAKVVATAATLTLPASAVTTISGTMNFQGAVGQLLSLRSSSTGVATTLTPTTVAVPYYLDVKDNTITTTTTCLASSQGCVNSTGNTGWTFIQSSSGGGGGGTDTQSLAYKTITVTSPNGGESYVVGSRVTITWNSTGNIDVVNVLYSPDNGATWTTLGALAMNLNAYQWIVDQAATSEGLIRVDAFDGITAYKTDTSNATFTIAGAGTEGDESDEISETSGASTDPDVVARVSALPSAVSVHGLFKLPNDGDASTQADSAVYYVGADGYRHAFPNQAIYNSWFVDFNDVQDITASDLAAIPFGKNVTYKPGVRMVKFLTSPKTYAVDVFGVLRWVETEDIAVSLYGNTWSTFIDDISDAFFGHYTIGSPITDADEFDPEVETTRTIYPSDSMLIPGYTM